MTKLLLWKECRGQHPVNGYAQFCHRYLGCQQRSMRQVHKVGEKLCVYYCGPRMAMVNSGFRGSAPNSMGRSHWLMASKPRRAVSRLQG